MVSVTRRGVLGAESGVRLRSRGAGLLSVFGPALLTCGFVACGTAGDQEAVAHVEQAINVCGASVASNLVVDGIPAYAQCDASSNSAIYSNNGVDTATSAASSEWKRTQYNGGYQCTELLHRYWLFKWSVSWIPTGNAGTWCDATPPANSGIVKTTSPVHGDAIVFAPGSCGADSVTGHVALIDTVDSAGSKVTFVEQNRAGRRSSNMSCASCFLHVVANDGTASGSGGSSAGGASTGTGGSSSGGRPGMATGGRSGATTGGGSNNSGGTSLEAGGAGAGGRPRNEGGSRSEGGATGSSLAGSPPGSAQGGSSLGTSTVHTGGASSTNAGSTTGSVASGGSLPVAGGASNTDAFVSPPQGGGSTSEERPGTSASGGAAGSSASSTGTTPAQDESGCNFRVGSAPSTWAWLLSLVALLAAQQRSSRRRARNRPEV
ncbi:MAG TPA: CHAP domain-containing protein [Polyangiaceae bacterium]|nr:CHAP domain-containing protein [Polyangiaceae bacterium]